MRRQAFCLVVLALLLALSVGAQTESPPERRIDLEQVRADRALAEANAT
ncbi:MAG: hypothetical protein GY906_15980, partial [bacterium]|nr:hypothetical protein [bacterium]